MKVPGIPYEPRYTSDEVVLGVVVAVALHLLAIGPFVLNAILPSGPDVEEKPLVARPVVQAKLLKLGKPLDPSKLPDRLVPQKRTAKHKKIVASREKPTERLDGGAPPPPDTEDSDIQNLIAKSELFAEDPTKVRPEEGSLLGMDGGTETDPSKVRAGDMYAAQLGRFFAEHMNVPTVISVGEARRLCAVMEMNIGRNMVIWYVKETPIRSSGNPLFDDAARTMLQKLRDDKTPLPQPPPAVDGQYRQRRVQLVILGDPHGDSSRCK